MGLGKAGSHSHPAHVKRDRHFSIFLSREEPSHFAKKQQLLLKLSNDRLERETKSDLHHHCLFSHPASSPPCFEKSPWMNIPSREGMALHTHLEGSLSLASTPDAPG